MCLGHFADLLNPNARLPASAAARRLLRQRQNSLVAMEGTVSPRADYSLEGKFMDTFPATSLLVQINEFLNVKRCEFDCVFAEGGGVCAPS